MGLKSLICALAAPFALSACKPPVNYEDYSSDRVKDAVAAYVSEQKPEYDNSTHYAYIHYDYWKNPQDFTIEPIQKGTWRMLLFFNGGGDTIATYPDSEESSWLPGEPEGLCRKLPLEVDWDRGEEYAAAAFCSGSKSNDRKNAEAWAKRMQELFLKKYR